MITESTARERVSSSESESEKEGKGEREREREREKERAREGQRESEREIERRVRDKEQLAHLLAYSPECIGPKSQTPVTPPISDPTHSSKKPHPM